MSTKTTRSATNLDRTVVTKTRGGTAPRPAARTAKKPAARGKRNPPPRPPFWRVQARDLWAVGLITLGVLLALALWGKQLGPVGHGVDTGLGLLAGWARVLLPLVAAGAGFALLLDRPGRDDDEGEEHEGSDPWRLAVGTVLGLLGICGLADLAKGSPAFSDSSALRDAGGYIGAAIGRPLHSGLGPAGASVLLVAVILVAILVATGVSLATAGRALAAAAKNIGRTFAALWQGKPFVITSDLGADAPVAATPSGPAPFDAEADDLPPDDEDEDVEDEIDEAVEPDPMPAPVASVPLPLAAGAGACSGRMGAPEHVPAAGVQEDASGPAPDRRPGRGPGAGARGARRRDAARRVPGRPDSDPLRARARPRGQGGPGHQPVQGHRLCHGVARRAHPRADPGQVGHRRRGAEPDAPAGVAARHPRVERGQADGDHPPARGRPWAATSPGAP